MGWVRELLAKSSDWHGRVAVLQPPRIARVPDIHDEALQDSEQDGSVLCPRYSMRPKPDVERCNQVLSP